ncbi:MAG: monooxygenase [Myxococcota bacterium]|nr:monooxygenase [Myxococcota bacterium]
MFSILFLACTTPPADEAPPTWHNDVAPIVDAYCANCHTEGNYGGFDLSDYETAHSMAEAIRISVVDRAMPPWMADSSCNDYQYDLSLTDAQIDTIADWVEAGAPEGEPSAAPEPAEAPEERTLSRVDKVIEMEAPYTPVSSPDEYRCFVLDWPYEEDLYVTGFSLNPDNTNVVHHGIAFILEPELAEEALALDAADDGQGYECFGGPGVAEAQDISWLGAWAPGGAAGDMPPGTGIGVSAGSKIVLQVHFNVQTSGASPAQVQLELMVEESVEKPAMIQPWADPSWLLGEAMPIPANTDNVTHDFSYTLSRSNFNIHYTSLHMHTRGVAARFWKTDADGNETCLLDIPNWDFDWQRSYMFQEPIETNPGDTLTVECTWDNPTDDTIYWGDNTTDEMCLATMYITTP